MSSENGKSLLLYYNRTFSVAKSSTLQLPEHPTIHATYFNHPARAHEQLELGQQFVYG
jgi:hypothetical protein